MATGLTQSASEVFAAFLACPIRVSVGAELPAAVYQVAPRQAARSTERHHDHADPLVS